MSIRNQWLVFSALCAVVAQAIAYRSYGLEGLVITTIIVLVIYPLTYWAARNQRGT